MNNIKILESKIIKEIENLKYNYYNLSSKRYEYSLTEEEFKDSIWGSDVISIEKQIKEKEIYLKGIQECLELSKTEKPIEINLEKFNTLMYWLTKHAAKFDFLEFLEDIEITEKEYDDIKKYLKVKYGVKTYV